MSRHQSDMQVCDCCGTIVGHLEGDDIVKDKTRLVMIVIEDFSYMKDGMQGTYDFCNMDCARKFFATAKYKDSLATMSKKAEKITKDLMN
jgi:hypothetical protein